MGTALVSAARQVHHRPMERSGRVASVVGGALVLVLAGCGDGSGAAARRSTTTAPAPTVYRGEVMVLEEPGSPPHVCTGGLEQSAPPHCEGVELTGWDWDAVEDEETHGATRWGRVELDVTREGERLAVVGVRPYVQPPPSEGLDEAPPPSPCATPAGGWASQVDDKKVSLADFQAFRGYLDASPDVSAFWVEGSTAAPALDLTIVRFARDAALHEAELRAIWGGPVCVVEGGRAKQELVALEATVMAEVDGRSVYVDQLAGQLRVGVLLEEPRQQADLDERYGAGTIVLTPIFVPVDPS